MARLTTVQFYKYPETPHWCFEMLELGSDEHGTWLGAPAGTPGRRGAEPPVVFEDAFVGLIPRSAWWTMIVNAAPRNPEIAIDVCTPAQWKSEGRVESVDLDLDVVRLRDGSVKLIDEEEFERHRIELGYPASLATNARVTAAELVLALEEARPPFDTTAGAWFDVLEAST